MPHGITQCYLPPGTGDIPALIPAEAGTRLSDPGGMQGCVDLKVVKGNYTAPDTGARSIVMNVSVCVCVCLSAIISPELLARSSPNF